MRLSQPSSSATSEKAARPVRIKGLSIHSARVTTSTAHSRPILVFLDAGRPPGEGHVQFSRSFVA